MTERILVFNPHFLSGPVHPYQLDEPRSNFSSVASVWVSTVCLCPKNGKLGGIWVNLRVCVCFTKMAEDCLLVRRVVMEYYFYTKFDIMFKPNEILHEYLTPGT